MKQLTQKQIDLFNALHAHRVNAFEVFNDREFRGVWSSIMDKYPEKAHFVYELLQNADDSEATEAYFILKKDQLIFRHNGTKHFDITSREEENVGDINSITGIGNSSKESIQNKIGKFGVGFKAVYQYTNTPEIYDDSFKFKIENYIVPTLIDNDHSERKDGETLFVFPFKNPHVAFDDIRKRLENLNNPILFLHHLKRVVWRIDESDDGKGADKEYSKVCLDSNGYEDSNIKFEHLRLIEPNKQSEIFLFTEPITIPKSDYTESSHLINVGFFYDSSEKRLITNIEQNVYCFFPTKETFKTCFISHAPFLLTDNRQNLKPGESINKTLVNLLAKLATQAIVYLRDYGIKHKNLLIDENITEIIYFRDSYHGYHYDDEILESAIKNECKNLLSNERIFLTRNNKYILYSEALHGIPKELLSLINQEKLVQLRGNQNVDFLKFELSQNIRNQRDSLFPEIQSYEISDIASDISEEFMSDQETKWVLKLYKYLKDHSTSISESNEKELSNHNKKPSFRYSSIIKTQSGKWIAPFDIENRPNVYLPLNDTSSTAYEFIDKEYLEDESAMQFFRELGIKEPDERDYIDKVILKRYEGGSVEVKDIISDFKFLISLYLKSEDNSELLELLKQKYSVVCKDYKLYKLNNIYFHNDLLEKYFAGNYDVHYFDIDFYSSVVDQYGSDKVKNFLKDLGVREYPEIIIQKNVEFPDIRYRLRGSSESYYRIKRIGEEYYLAGFDALCKRGNISLDLSKYIWNNVLGSIELETYSRVEFVYRKYHGKTDLCSYCDSSFKYSLIHNKWIYDKDGRLVSPSEIYLEDLDSHYNRNENIEKFLELREKPNEQSEADESEIQQESSSLEQQIKKMCPDKSVDEIIKKFKEFLEQENREKNNKENGRSLRNSEDKKIHQSSDDGFHRDELSENTLDMFDDANIQKTSSPKVKEQKVDSSDKDDKFEEKLEEEKKKHDRTKELHEIVNASPKYSKEWFDALIELEYRGGVEKSNETPDKAINISFGSVYKEQSGERIYVFGNPSRSVPLWLEEIGDIDVKCSFYDAEDVSLHFDVANVRDNSLRLKANKSDEIYLDSINWNSCTKASINVNDNIDLMGRFRSAFNSLGLPEHFDLKQNLPTTLKFIFGPPGTGKTTNIAEKILEIINNSATAKILVLSPTNTGCDEVARKIISISPDNYNWMCRFVSSADENLEEIVADRESAFYAGNKCCVISTIARLSFDAFNGIDGSHKLRDIEWDYIFIDEASMIPLAELVFAIYQFKDKKIVISGDPMQIKPILMVDDWKDENIYTMVNLNRFENPITEPVQFEIENLVKQYRSLPPIGELFSQYSYNGKLKHNRSMLLANELKLGALELKPINFISFKVEKYDSIFGPKKLDNSNVHIYSVILVVETCKYVINELIKNNVENYSIGIVCPYAPQAQLIESILNQTMIVPDNISVTIGTVHRFQGGQCNMMFTVLNPPRGLKFAPERIFLNNKNILNVAISRAMDCLCMFIPHRDTDGFENLYELNKIGRIAIQDPSNLQYYTCDQLEEIIFGKKFFIEDNTFVTSHQMANVYSQAAKRYEVRIDDNSVDIQLGENN